MLAAAVIVFREVLEAALIVGIVLAATRDVTGARTNVVAGIIAGLFGALVLALTADRLSQALAGMGQEIFNAGVLMFAVVMLAWHNVWMSKHGREIARDMVALGRDVASRSRPMSALAIVVGLAILREGAETVLFLYGVLSSGKETAALTALGGLGGLAAGCVVGTGLYFGLVAIPTRYLFTVTTWLITLLAAGMAAQAVVLLGAAGLVSFSTDAVWDTSSLLSETSIFGRLFHTLIGYTDRPTVAQIVVYLATIGAIVSLTKTIGRENSAGRSPSRAESR